MLRQGQFRVDAETGSDVRAWCYEREFAAPRRSRFVVNTVANAQYMKESEEEKLCPSICFKRCANPSCSWHSGDGTQQVPY